ncbi:MAG: carboxypeptidase-like regulatory domain-containing protein [Bacteroidetes bacterium]|nr:carboxypeptidase-like regulatory domain-containing protein [Bacteroidota bacterium]
MRTFSFILLFFLTLHVYSQHDESYLIQGKVVDSITNEAIPNVSIEIKGQNNNIICSENGSFAFHSCTFPVEASFSHISYSTQIFLLKEIKNTIKLSAKTSMLKSVVIEAVKPKMLIADIPYHITDYDFKDDHIVFIGYKDKITKKAYLCEINENGDTIYTSKIPKPEELFEDYKGDKFLLTNSDAWKFPEDSFFLDIHNYTAIEDFSKYIKPVILEKNNKLFFKQYYYNNQLLQYYYYDKYARVYNEFVEIADRKKLIMLSDRNRVIASSSDPEMQQRFEDLAFYQPVYAPLLRVRDTICIFNFTESYIELYSDSFNLIKKIPVTFNTDKHWKRQIFKDEVNEKVYTLYITDGISTLKEIDFNTGEIVNSVKIPDLPYVQDIKIYDNCVYFLYTNQNPYANYRSLYKMKI